MPRTSMALLYLGLGEREEARRWLARAREEQDRSSGPNRGTVYLLWADYEPGGSARCVDTCSPSTTCTTDVFFSRSFDGRRSWSRPDSVPGRAARSDRYFPWARVDPSTGALYVAYKDTRLDERRIATDVYLSRSPDGGASWESPLRLSTASSDASGASFQYGDYQGLSVSMGRVFAAWSDYRNTEDGEIYVGQATFALPP